MDLFITRRGGGGSGGFGLRVRAYADLAHLPIRATHNSVAIISNVGVKGVTVSDSLPEPIEVGDVWITTNTAGGTEVMLGGNDFSMPIRVTGVQQYDGLQWRRVEAYAWMSGEWTLISIQKVPLYENGTDITELTGGWTIKKDGGASVTMEADAIRFEVTGSQGRYGSIYSKNKIDVTSYSRLCAVVTHEDQSGGFIFGVIGTPYSGVSGATFLSSLTAGIRVSSDDITAEKMTFEVDISSVSGEVYVQCSAAIFAGKLHELYLA